MRRFELVTAPHDGGKTANLLSHHKGVPGFVTTNDGPGKERLFLHQLDTGEERLLMERPEGGGSYIVNQEAFDYANEYIMDIHDGLVVLDECGWMERDGGGFRPALDHILSCDDISAVLAIRLDMLDWYLSLFEGVEACVVRLS